MARCIRTHGKIYVSRVMVLCITSYGIMYYVSEVWNYVLDVRYYVLVFGCVEEAHTN